MIFIGAELSDPHAHFVTNIVDCIGSGDDLIIDLLKVKESKAIFDRIATYLKIHDESYVIYNAYTDEDFFIGLKERFPELQLITVFSDDEWRHANYDRYLALYSDIFTIAVKGNIQRYEKYGLSPFYMRWACNPDMFHPLTNLDKDIDVSFIGAAYGQRADYIRFLIANGINIRVFGRGWDRHSDIRRHWGGYLSHKEMLEVIARSRINLNFLWTSAEKERCTIKARTLELSACRAFQLSNHTNEFANYGFSDTKNIAIFHDKQDILDKIQHYLQHDGEREAIARQAYEHVLHHHTWKQRFQAIFERLENASDTPVPIHHQSRILVVVRPGIQHQINTEDEGLEIHLVSPASDWQKKAIEADGVIYLDHDSTLNNDTLNMMVFALVADKSDVVAANFYAGSRANRYWIRFIDRIVEKKPQLLRLLPSPCLMFSGKYAAEYGCELASDLSQLKVSYIEYPSFWSKLPYFQSRKLRLYFAYHGDSRQNFKAYLRSMKIGKAWSLGVDKIWQKNLQKKTGV